MVRVTPKSARDAVEGVAEDDAGRSYLKVRVRAVPENGAANKAVCKLIAKTLALPKSAVSLHAGETARVKQVYVGASGDEVVRALGV
jgi:uncharacterized protein YggU (UPF0235/DUF167 family)